MIKTDYLLLLFVRYGVIHGTGSAELQPLDKAMEEEEEEEDMTLFDRKDTKWPR